MDTLTALAMGQASRGQKMMVFDWDMAARIIKERGAQEASAGLRGDWKWTGGDILRGGKPVPAEETYTFLASSWAVPELEIDGEIIPCFFLVGDGRGWNASTYWPQSAIDILVQDGRPE